ncbi:MAG: type II secretion system F family protein [Candidatus Nanopelagicales bacterium]
MISLAAVACALLVHHWLPYTAHPRAMRLAGRPDLAPDDRLLAWWQARKLQTPGQPRTTRLLQTLIAELQAGIIPIRAFTHVLGARYSEPSALIAYAPTADAHIWRDVAQVWSSAEEVGFSMATALQRVHSYALTDQEVFREVAAAAAAPRFAMLTLALMPAAAWMIAASIGGNPFRFLLTSPIGWACTASGITLVASAGWWMRRLARNAFA